MSSFLVPSNLKEALQYYQSQQSKLLSLLTTHGPGEITGQIWGPNGIFIVDKDCRCNAGKHRETDKRTLFTRIKCINCEIISIYNGKFLPQFNFNIDGKVTRSYAIVAAPIKVFKALIEVKDQESKDRRTRVLLDAYTNNIVMHIIINDILRQSNIPNSFELLTTFVCGNTSYRLQQASLNLNLLPNLTSPSVMIGLIAQIFVLSNALSHFSFFSGQESRIKFIESPAAYSYAIPEEKKLIVSSPVTLLLDNLDSSRIEIGTRTILSLDWNLRSDIAYLSKSLTLDDTKGEFCLHDSSAFSLLPVETYAAFNFYTWLAQLLSVPIITKYAVKTDKIMRVLSRILPSNAIKILRMAAATENSTFDLIYSHLLYNINYPIKYSQAVLAVLHENPISQ